MSRAEDLYNLQQTDSQIDRSNRRVNEINIILEDDSAVIDARSKTQAANESLQETKKKLQLARTEVQSQRTKIKQSEDRLYSGKVVNPKELEDIQDEIGALKRYLEVLEENQLEEMMELDEVQERYDTAQSHLEQAISNGEARNTELLKEKTSIETNISALKEKREQQISGIAAEDLQHYEKLRSKRAGVAVASVQDRNCAACGSTLGTAKYQQARSPSKLVQCETCERILFAE